MTIKIDKTDISWHADQPNKPAKTGDEMKAFFDAPIEILRQKINEVIDDADATAPDQSYNGASDRPQSGTAVAEAVNPLILQEMSATKPPLDNVLPLLAAIDKHKPIVICGEDGGKYFADAAYTDDTYIYVEYSALSADGEIEKRRARYGRDGVAAERLYAYKPQKLTVDQNYHWASTNPQSGTAVAEALETVKNVYTITTDHDLALADIPEGISKLQNDTNLLDANSDEISAITLTAGTLLIKTTISGNTNIVVVDPYSDKSNPNNSYIRVIYNIQDTPYVARMADDTYATQSNRGLIRAWSEEDSEGAVLYLATEDET